MQQNHVATAPTLASRPPMPDHAAARASRSAAGSLTGVLGVAEVAQQRAGTRSGGGPTGGGQARQAAADGVELSHPAVELVELGGGAAADLGAARRLVVAQRQQLADLAQAEA